LCPDSVGAGNRQPHSGWYHPNHARHRVPFLRVAARFMGGIDGCVLIRSSNTAVLVPDLRTAVSEGRNGDGCVLIRSASSIVGTLWGVHQPGRAR